MTLGAAAWKGSGTTRTVGIPLGSVQSPVGATKAVHCFVAAPSGQKEVNHGVVMSVDLADNSDSHQSQSNPLEV